jgi:hypothetical protein
MHQAIKMDFGSKLKNSTTIRYISVLKVKVKVKFTLEQATKAQRVRRDIALLFL